MKKKQAILMQQHLLQNKGVKTKLVRSGQQCNDCWDLVVIEEKKSTKKNNVSRETIAKDVD